MEVAAEFNFVGQFTVSVINPFEFSIGDTRGFGSYTGGGVVCQLARRKIMNFQPLASQLNAPVMFLVLPFYSLTPSISFLFFPPLLLLFPFSLLSGLRLWL